MRVLLLSLCILAIGWGSIRDISGQVAYNTHVSDTEGNTVEYATAVLLSGEKQIGGAGANGDGDDSIAAEAGKRNLSGAVSGTFTPRDKGEMNTRREYRTQGNEFVSQSLYDTDSKYGNGRVGAVFEIDSSNSVGAEIEYISHASDGTYWSLTDLVRDSCLTNSAGNYMRKDDYNTFSATVNYLCEMDGRGSVFKVIADYVGKRSTGDKLQTICYERSVWSRDTVYRSNSVADYDMATTDISFQKNFRGGMSLRVGAKYTYALMDDHSLYEGLASGGNWVPDEDYGYALRYHENIVGAYVSFSGEIKNWSLAAGVRAEYSKASDRSGDFSRDYLDLFPNLNVTYAFDPVKRWMLVGQYARNIERPPFYTLNPNRIQGSDYSYQIGNSYLRPTYINRFSVTLAYNYRYTLTVGGNLHHDLIREFCKQDMANPNVSYITYENHDRENHWFVAVSLSYQPFAWYSLTGNEE